MKSLVFSLIMSFLAILMACSSDNITVPETTVEDDVVVDGVLITAENYHELIGISLNLSFDQLSTDDDLIRAMQHARSKEDFFNAVEESTANNYPEAMGKVAIRLGESLSEEGRRRQCQNNLKQLGIALHSFGESDFSNGLKIVIDTAVARVQDHKKWIIIESVASASVKPSDDPNDESFLIDLERTIDLYESKIRPGLLTNTNQSKVREVMSNLLEGNDVSEAVLTAMLYTARDFSGIETRKSSIKRAVGQLIGSNEDLIDNAVIDSWIPGLYDAMFYGMVFASYYDDPPCDDDVHCAAVAVFDGMYQGAMNYLLHQIWEFTSQERIYNVDALVGDGELYGTAYAEVFAQTLSSLQSDISISEAVLQSSTKEEFLNSIENAINVSEWNSRFDAIEGAVSGTDPVGHLRVPARDLTLSSLRYDDSHTIFIDGLEQLITEATPVTGYLKYKLDHAFVKSWAVSGAGLNESEETITFNFGQIQQLFDELDFDALKDKEVLKETVRSLIAEGREAEGILTGLLIPAVLESENMARSAIESMAASRFGSVPAALSGQQNLWSDADSDLKAGLYGAMYALFGEGQYGCDNKHCGLVNILHEMYLASFYYSMNNAFEFIENHQNTMVIEEIVNDADAFGTAMADALGDVLQIMNDPNNGPAIIGSSETFENFLDNVEMYTTAIFPNAMSQLSASMNCNIPEPLRSSTKLQETAANGVFSNIEDTLPTIVQDLAVDASEPNAWLNVLIEKSLDNEAGVSLLGSTILDYNRLLNRQSSLDMEALLTDQDYLLLKQSMIESLDLTNDADPVMISIIWPAVQSARASARSASRASDIVGFLEIALAGPAPNDVYQTIDTWDEGLHDILFHAALYVFLKADSFGCNQNVECIYSNVYNEMYLIVQNYYLGQMWKYIESLQ
ncbi:MAG: DUF1559 domain-containing protein [Cyclobacteriaceae bacterium]